MTGYREDLTRGERFERMLDEVRAAYEQTVLRMEQLRAQDRTKTVSYRELMGKKMMLQQMLTLYRAHGLIE